MIYDIIRVGGDDMYIRKTKVPYKEDYLVYLVESFRNEKNQVRQRVLESYGYLSDLTKDNPNALEELKTWAKKQTEAQKADTSIHLELNMNEAQDGTQKPLNYGYIFLEAIYHELNIPSFIRKYSNERAFKYDLDAILKLLVYSRALNPESKKKTFEHKGHYFFEMKDIELSEMYRSLSELNTLKDDLMIHLNKELTKKGLRDASLVFYDVTNYYFESDINDGFREKGVSKERKKTGIVQMGLFIDKQGIPITYELFPGNTNDLSTMRPILEKIKKQFNLGKLTIVADKGNNSSTNLAQIDSYGDDYIIAQKIRGRGTPLADIVLDQEGYHVNQEGTFKHKLVRYERNVKDADGTTKTLTEHLMCFWSEKEARFQRAKRGLLDEKIEKFIEDPSLLNASNSFGIKKYFKQINVDSKTGEVLKGKKIYAFNQEKYQRDLELDGYYAIVTNNLDMHPLDIIKHYRQLSMIEESFKVTKSDLEGRPIYVWKEDHIKGHFLTCYLALVLYRVLQTKLDKNYPIHQLKEALNSAQMIRLAKHIVLLQDTSELFKTITDAFSVNLNFKTMKIENFVQSLKQIT